MLRQSPLANSLVAASSTRDIREGLRAVLSFRHELDRCALIRDSSSKLDSRPLDERGLKLLVYEARAKSMRP
jgi:hypothetical protein